MTGLYFTDSSAILKLFLAEEHSPAIKEFCSQHAAKLAASELVITEVIGTLNGLDLDTRPAKKLLASLHLMPVHSDVLQAAADLVPKGARALDAIHLATALQLGSKLLNFVSYDKRQLEAATAIGIQTLSPTR